MFLSLKMLLCNNLRFFIAKNRQFWGDLGYLSNMTISVQTAEQNAWFIRAVAIFITRATTTGLLTK